MYTAIYPMPFAVTCCQRSLLHAHRLQYSRLCRRRGRYPAPQDSYDWRSGNPYQRPGSYASRDALCRQARFHRRSQDRQADSTAGLLLRNIPSARLFEEVLKLFMAGRANDTLTLLHEFDLLQQLLPSAAKALDGGDTATARLLQLAMRNADHRIRNDKRVTPAFIFAPCCGGCGQTPAAARTAGHTPSQPHGTLGCYRRTDGIHRYPKRFQQTMREIWDLQGRLPRRQGKHTNALRTPALPRHYDFILLREESGEDLGGLGRWWTDYQRVDAEAENRWSPNSKAKGDANLAVVAVANLPPVTLTVTTLPTTALPAMPANL